MSKRKRRRFIENVLIENYAAEGKSVARHNDKVIFVQNVVPQDVVDIKIIKNKKSYAEAIPVNFINYSPIRKEPFCKHFGSCGGCKWQHLEYSKQLEFKQQQVKDAMERIGKLDLPDISPVLGSEHTTYYRNKLEFTFSDKRWLTSEEIETGKDINDRNGLGFHVAGRYDKVVDVEHCHLQGSLSNEIRNAVRDYALENDLSFFNITEQHGFLRNLIIRTTSTGETMVILQVFHNDQNNINNILEHLKTSFPDITSLMYVVNEKKNETFHDLDVELYAGKPYLEEKMEGLTFRIGPKSFYQTNSLQAYELYKIVREYAGLTGKENVYDLYTGTGTIANFVAGKAKKVVGLEYVPMAVEDAWNNSEINDIGNTSFYAGDIKDLLTEEFFEKHGSPDVIITDPPRAGMHKDVVKQILQAGPEKIVYVSCNPATQARDLEMMKEQYEVVKVQPVDMFPMTHHIENVVLLRRNGSIGNL